MDSTVSAVPGHDRVTRVAAAARELRREIVSMTAAAGSGHPGGSLSAADIMACLFFDVLQLRPEDPQWPGRDRFVLSKGHAAPVLYAALGLRGFFPREWLITLRKLGSRLQGHPHMRATPGVEVSTGSLGQGLSMACGMAAAAKLDRADWKVYCLLGDGETQEGQVWEAAAAASHYRLDNLIAIVDHNRLQIDGPVEQVMSVEPMGKRWEAFGWQVIEVDGHDIGAMLAALDALRVVRGGPKLMICNTVKGKGVSFMEGKAEWHGKAPTKEQLAAALAELAAEPREAGGGRQ